MLRYGEDPATWPEDTRNRAEALLLDSEEARAAQEEMRALRLALKKDPLKAPKGLAQDILTKALESDKANGTQDDVDQQDSVPDKSAEKKG